jgi:hypothetical protein
MMESKIITLTNDFSRMLGEPVDFNFPIERVFTEDLSIEGTSYLFLNLILITSVLGVIMSIVVTKLDR